MSTIDRLKSAASAASQAALREPLSLEGDASSTVREERVLRSLQQQERDLSEHVQQLRAEVKRRRDDAQSTRTRTTNATNEAFSLKRRTAGHEAKRALTSVAAAMASEAIQTSAVVIPTMSSSGDKFEPTSRDEIEAFASIAGIRVVEASSSVSTTMADDGVTGGSNNFVLRVRHYVLAGTTSGVNVRLSFDVNEGSLLDKERDIAITSAHVHLTPVFAMAELDRLIDNAETRGAIGDLLRLLPRYARLAETRRNAMAAARQLLAARCDDAQHETDDDFELVLRCQPRGAHLFAFDVHWDIDYVVELCRVRSTLSFRCHPTASLVAEPALLADMEQRFIQLAQHHGFLRAVELVLELATFK